MHPLEKDQFILKQILRLQAFINIPILASAKEILGDYEITRHISNMVSSVDGFRKKDWTHASELGLYRIALFSLTRAIKPKSVLETGVLHGFTSLVMLWALQKNGSGRLTSIDLPSPFGEEPANRDGYYDTLPQDYVSGWVVGSSFAEYWDLILGSSQTELKKINQKYPIDLFVHDSDHTYQNMMAEFKLVWDKLKIGGILIADNVDGNTAFSDFSIKVDRAVLYLPSDPTMEHNNQYKTRVGIIVK